MDKRELLKLELEQTERRISPEKLRTDARERDSTQRSAVDDQDPGIAPASDGLSAWLAASGCTELQPRLAELRVLAENDLLLLQPADIDRMCACETVPTIPARKFRTALDR